MLLRGILVALSGFVFIFAPGVPMGMLRRYRRGFPREHLYWGMGIWLVTLLPTYFLQSLVRQAFQGAGSSAVASGGLPSTTALSLITPLLAALFVVGGMAIYLHRKRLPLDERTEAGLTLGLGAGLIAQVFRGLDFVGGGLRLAYEGAGDPGLAPLAQAPLLDLGVALLAEILFRIAFLTISGVVGILVARAVGGSARSFWSAAGVYAAFSWLIVAMQLAIGGENPGATLAGQASLIISASTAVYYILAAALAYHWVQRQLRAEAAVAPESGKRAGRGRRGR